MENPTLVLLLAALLSPMMSFGIAAFIVHRRSDNESIIAFYSSIASLIEMIAAVITIPLAIIAILPKQQELLANDASLFVVAVCVIVAYHLPVFFTIWITRNITLPKTEEL